MMQRRRAAQAPVDGVLVLDKPVGVSSNTALQQARRLLGARKAGHGGTLDPLASGVLPLLFGEATKFAADLLDADKTYEATLALGVTTETGDAEGAVLARRAVETDEAAVRAACAAFVGQIEQTPPMHSALKRDGKPLYAYAREGVVLDRPSRWVRVHALDVLHADLAAAPPQVTVRVRCSKGTYVRTLAEQIGSRLACGAHLAALRRIAAGPLDIAQAVTPQALEALAPEARASRLLPLDALLQTLPRVDLPEAEAARFRQGQRLALQALAVAAALGPDRPSGAEATGSTMAGAAAWRVRVYDAQGLIGLAELASTGRLAPLRLVVRPAVGSTLAPHAPAASNDAHH